MWADLQVLVALVLCEAEDLCGQSAGDEVATGCGHEGPFGEELGRHTQRHQLPEAVEPQGAEGGRHLLDHRTRKTCEYDLLVAMGR